MRAGSTKQSLLRPSFRTSTALPTPNPHSGQQPRVDSLRPDFQSPIAKTGKSKPWPFVRIVGHFALLFAMARVFAAATYLSNIIARKRN